MIDIQFVRDNPELVKEKSKQKGYDVNIDELLSLDTDRKELLGRVELLRQRRNEISSQMKGGKPDESLINEGKELKVQLATQEEYLRSTEEKWLNLHKKIPNMPLGEVPVGISEEENVIDKTWGEKPVFDFEAKNHWQIAQFKGWIDKERASKVSGSRFAYIKGNLVRLQFAIVNYVFDILSDAELINKLANENSLNLSIKAFTPILPIVFSRKMIYG